VSDSVLPCARVESASLRIAERHVNDEFSVSPSRLSDIETKGSVPSIFRLYSLAVIYRCDVREVLSWYGIDLGLSAADLNLNLPPRSHVTETQQGAFAVKIPTRLDPAFDPRRSSNLSRMVEQWGLVPLAHLSNFMSEKYTYGYIGSEDFTMHPLLPPGTFLQVDESRSQVVPGIWRFRIRASHLLRGDPRRLHLFMVQSERRPDRAAAASTFAGGSESSAASAGSGSRRSGSGYCAQAGRVASGRVFTGFETRVERACNTELKCRADPPLKSRGSNGRHSVLKFLYILARSHL